MSWSLLAASVVLGLFLSTRVRPLNAPPVWTTDLHRFLGGLATIFVGVHVVAIMLDSYTSFGVTDVLVVVTRSFGGTKLGVGGLARAYAGAADAALGAAPRLVRYAMDPLEISFPHSQVSPVMRAISVAEARIIETVYDDAVRIRLEVRRSRTASLRTMLINQTGGKAVLRDTP